VQAPADTPLDSKKADEATTAIILKVWPFAGKIHSLTMDNSKELSEHETVAALPQTKVHLAHPYAAGNGIRTRMQMD